MVPYINFIEEFTPPYDRDKFPCMIRANIIRAKIRVTGVLVEEGDDLEVGGNITPASSINNPSL